MRLSVQYRANHTITNHTSIDQFLQIATELSLFTRAILPSTFAQLA